MLDLEFGLRLLVFENVDLDLDFGIWNLEFGF